jgi:hypothetical protein
MRANAWEEIGKELKIKCKTWREDSVSPAEGRGHTNLTSRELMWCYECSWDI